ncbi:MAG: energy-coupling factor transporter transmembrane component T [Nitrospiraceae bacterium]|nr:energy-coupling factor transporter transmembrane component T [Nitrospiraceae bacterium]
MTTKISPELKIIIYVLFLASLFVIRDMTGYLFLLGILCICLVKLPLKSLKAGWLPISLFLFFTFIGNVLGRHGKVLLPAGLFTVTDEGLHIAAFRTVRIGLMIGGAKILMASAKTEDMVAVLGRLFGPFERIGIPVKDFFHIMGLTVKCFPVLKDMASEAYQKNAGNADARGFWGRAKVISVFLMPLFVQSLQSPESFFEGGDPAGGPSHEKG